MTDVEKMEILKALDSGDRRAPGLLSKYGGLPEMAVTDSMMGAITSHLLGNYPGYMVCKAGYLKFPSFTTTPEQRDAWVNQALAVLKGPHTVTIQ